MSWQRPLLNRWLRLTERPVLAKGAPETVRRNLETKSRLFFRPPRAAEVRRETVGGVPALVVGAERPGAGPRILYLHGGGYVFGSARTHHGLLGKISQMTGLEAVLPDYRLAPEHPFPAAFDDALAAYRAMAAAPGGVIIGGDSAGGGLALALLAEILRQGLPKPLGVFAFSPLTDMTFSGRSFSENAARDVMLPAARASEMGEMYLGDADPRDPRASPLHAGFNGAPPVWLTVGRTEILRDDTLRMAETLRAEGVEVDEIIEGDLPHVWPIFHSYLPEARATLRHLAAWIRPLATTAAPRPDES
ncbi:alpha/beta hydrolase [Poseidonocella sedimentorum]|uniref:Acetyl esterase/lipase n=1 Tax=Poseidonocella sedimentorum TaxID=871652 RepID=A0A1I6DSK7_9RHOB|nr:alpha/beta hydrolase [Poseidonocella sedimentorum]SFR08357.1 Acetyl esterase/lipase [Poseidonocella sedimentorum]